MCGIPFCVQTISDVVRFINIVTVLYTHLGRTNCVVLHEKLRSEMEKNGHDESGKAWSALKDKRKRLYSVLKCIILCIPTVEIKGGTLYILVLEFLQGPAWSVVPWRWITRNNDRKTKETKVAQIQITVNNNEVTTLLLLLLW